MRKPRPAVLGALALLSATAADGQRRAYLAQHRADLDGDGAIDTIRLTTDGAITVRIGGAELSESSVPAGAAPPRSGSITASKLAASGEIIILVEAFANSRGKNGTATATVLSVQQGRMAVLWRGGVGPQGTDGEWSEHLTLTRERLERYQTHPGARSCAGEEPLHLYPEIFDFGGARRFRAVRSRAPSRFKAASRQDLGSSSRQALDTAPAFVRAFAATSALGARNAGELAPPLAIDDGDPATAWVDGRGGDGRGEVILFRQPPPIEPIAAIAVIGGHGHSKRSLRDDGRVMRIGLEFFADGKLVRDAVIQLDDQAIHPLDSAMSFRLRAPVAADCIEATILATYPGAAARGRRDDLAIAELQFLTTAELAGQTERVLARDIASDNERAARAIDVLRASGPRGRDALLAEFAATSEVNAKVRLAEAMATMNDATLGQAIAEVIGMGDVSSKRRADLVSGLARLGAGAGPTLFSLAGDRNIERPLRELALKAAGEIELPDKLTRYIALGETWTELGATVAETAASDEAVSAAQLAGAAESAQTSAIAAEMWLAAAIKAQRAPTAEQRELVAMMDKHLQRAGNSYELRYRLLEGLARLDGGAAAIERWWASAGAEASSATIALRRAAIGATGDHANALTLRRLALADSDPGVRAAALEVGPSDDAETARYRSLAVDDPWPFVRRLALEGLAQRCNGSGVFTTMRTAAERDRSPEVVYAAIYRLLQCGPPSDASAAVVAIIGDAKRSGEIRAYAALQLGNLRYRRNTQPLVDALAKSRQLAFEDTDERALAASLVTALGRQGDRAGLPAILEAAADEAYPSIQAAAAAALGSFCGKDAAATLRRLAQHPEREVVLAAKLSLRQCQTSR